MRLMIVVMIIVMIITAIVVVLLVLGMVVVIESYAHVPTAHAQHRECRSVLRARVCCARLSHPPWA